MPAVRNPLAGWPRPEFHVVATFRAPIDFVYRWCTDYSPVDPTLEGEEFERKVLERGPRKAVFEDLEEDAKGWLWSRSEVRLHPPRRWELLERGNRSEAAATYALRELSDGRVRLDLRWRRRDLVPYATKISAQERERRATLNWRRFSAALERDYRTRRHPRR